MTNVIIEEFVRAYCEDFGIDCPLDDTDTEADPPCYPSEPIEEIATRNTEEYHNLLKLDALAWTYDKTVLDIDYMDLRLDDTDLRAIGTELDETDWALLDSRCE